jgi:hypothetical protein
MEPRCWSFHAEDMHPAFDLGGPPKGFSLSRKNVLTFRA